MASEIDALQSFTNLTENVPLWLSRLDTLVTKCEIQYERFTRITKHGEVKLSRKKKHASTESLRPGQDGNTTATLKNNKEGAAIAPLEASPTSPPTDAPVGSPQNKDNSRKRPAGSELSGTPTNHCMYRSKAMVVVYYDSEIQDMFEALVKNIATARNCLRKGKITASFKTRIASIGLGLPPSDTSDDHDDGIAPDPKALMAKMRTSRQAASNEMKTFEDADKDLETAQNLCERAAHQFLRDGDCSTEVESTKKRFINCENIAKREVERLNRVEQAARNKQREKDKQGEEKKVDVVSTRPPDRMEEKPIAIDITYKVTAPPPLKELHFAGSGAIEIDDCSDESEVQIDLSAIRRTVRTTRA